MTAVETAHKKKIFVSYSRKDEEWLERLRYHLKVLEREGHTEFWIDKDRLRAGEVWTEDLQRAIDSADGAILLVSAGYLSTDFIWEDELPALERAYKQRKCRLLIVMVSAVDLSQTFLGPLQKVRADYLAGMGRQQFDEFFQEVVKQVRDTPILAAHAPETRKDRAGTTSAHPPPAEPASGTERPSRVRTITRHQLFLGSSFWSLEPRERLAALEAILRLPLVVTGGEYLFPEQRANTRSILDEIEESDYFVAIVPGGEQATLPEGISLGQIDMEYRHAVNEGKPVIGLLQVPFSKTAGGALADYRRQIESTEESMPWTDATDLAGQLTVALDALGPDGSEQPWIRARKKGTYQRLHMPRDSMHRISILEEMADVLKPAGVEREWLGPARTSLDFTIRDLEKICRMNWSDLDSKHTASAEQPFQVVSLLHAARGEAFDRKYGNRTGEHDERYIAGNKSFGSWAVEVKQFLKELGVENLTGLRVVNVGIGNGIEGKDGQSLYGEFKPFYGVDIAPGALAAATAQFTSMIPCITDGRNDSAERLASIKDGALDLYLSFRTYQSTLFDIDRALYEACRVLRRDGLLLISIPYKYVDKKGALAEGLLRPESEFLDTELPFAYQTRIRRKLRQLKFTNISYHTGKVELYVSARRSL